MVKYLGSLAHPMATSLMGSVKDGGSVILEITLSYYWDYLLLVGIYSSANFVSEDTKLRQSIHDCLYL
jgi:hypothetical protein